MTAFQQGIIQICMGFGGSLGFSVLYNVRGKKLFLAALGGGASWALYLLLGGIILDVPVRYFLCACFVAVYAEVLARVLKTPATTFLIPSMIPHIPGGALYQTMRYALDKAWMDCLYQAFYTFKLALALALGFVVVRTVFNVAGILRCRSHKEEHS